MPVPGTKRRTEPLPVDLGGTGAVRAPLARENLEVPGLGENNAFTGLNSFSQTTTFNGPVVFNTGVGFSSDVVLGDSSADSVVTNGVLRVWSALEVPGVGGLFPDFTGNLALDENFVCANLTSGDATVTLPTAVTCAGRLYILKNSGAGTLTLDANGSETIDGALTQTIASGAALTVISTGAGWIIV